jgi:hypothetical protein
MWFADDNVIKSLLLIEESHQNDINEEKKYKIMLGKLPDNLTTAREISHENARKLCELNEWPIDRLDYRKSVAGVLRAIERGILSGKISPYENSTFFKVDDGTHSLQTSVFLKNEVNAYLESILPSAHQAAAPIPAVNSKPLNNDVGFSGLLHIPQKVDDWFGIIDDMTRDYHGKNKKIPTKTKAWVQMSTSQVKDYSISIITLSGEDCLSIVGLSPLSKSAFYKRWVKYTANQPQ